MKSEKIYIRSYLQHVLVQRLKRNVKFFYFVGGCIGGGKRGRGREITVMREKKGILD